MNVVFSASAVQFTQGAPKEYVCTGTSGAKTHRGFCAECGSPVSARAALIPEIRGISAASLDDPSRLGAGRSYLDGECPAVGRLVFDSPAV